MLVEPDPFLRPHLVEFDDGRILENEDGWVARVWLPLAEPLPLPDGWSRTVARPSSFTDAEYLGDVDVLDGATVIEGSVVVVQMPKTVPPLDFRGLEEALAARSQALGDDHDKDQPPGEDLPITVTVLDVTTIGWTDNSNETRSQAFDLSVSWVQQLQREVRAGTKRPVPLITRQLLPPTLPIDVYQLRDRDSPSPDLSTWIQLHLNVNEITEAGELDEAERDRFDTASLFSNRPGLRTPATDVMFEAHLALNRRGDTRACVLAAATYVEATLDHLLAALLWEERSSPTKAAEVFDGTVFRKRMRKNFPGLLGGAWDGGSSPIFAAWEDRCHRLRHRVIHQNYYPSFSEAKEGLTAATDLVQEVVDRLAAKATEFPRTAFKWVGSDGLPPSPKLRKTLDKISNSEPDWDDMFDRWLRTMWSSTQFRHRDGRLDRSVPMVVVTGRPSTGYWVALDPELMLGCVVRPPADDDRKNLITQALTKGGDPRLCPLSLLVPGSAADFEIVGEWTAAYRIAPPDQPLHPTAVWPVMRVESGPLP